MVSVEDPNVYCDRIFKLMQRWNKCFIVLREDADK
jgi:hypothetical protein